MTEPFKVHRYIEGPCSAERLSLILAGIGAQERYLEMLRANKIKFPAHTAYDWSPRE